MIHKLMIKTHNKTGLKYLCYTRKKDHDSYTGSGIDWLSHLLTHGFDFTTELIFESENFNDFKEIAIEKSLEFDVVNSENWANRKIEEGDGGDTVSYKKWITNGIEDKYLDKNVNLPEGWKYGRTNCVFNDKEKQKEFASKSDPVKRGLKIKEAWDNGKFDKRDLTGKLTGDKNPAKRPEVREKIRKAALLQSEERSIRMKKMREKQKNDRNNSN